MRALCWLLVMSIATLLAPHALADNLERQKAGVVRITATTEGKRKTGTGFVVRHDANAAYILTASHVVEGDKQPEVEFFTGRNLPVRAQTVRLEGGDPRGLALLIVRGAENLPQGIQVLALADRAALQGGETLTVIGFPLGGGPWAVVRGTVVSRDGRDLTLDGSVDEGNSGGPALTEEGVAGVITSTEGKFAHAVPASLAKLVLDGWGVGALPSAAAPSNAKERHSEDSNRAAPTNEAAPPGPVDRAYAGSGALRILHAACEKLRAGTSYRVTLSGDGQGPTGAALRMALWNAERKLSAPTPSCKDWKTCERQARDPERTGWSMSTITAGAAPTEVRAWLGPAGIDSGNAAYAEARAELDCLRNW
jgi:S1-C subfamily serine protease